MREYVEFITHSEYELRLGCTVSDMKLAHEIRCMKGWPLTRRYKISGEKQGGSRRRQNSAEQAAAAGQEGPASHGAERGAPEGSAHRMAGHCSSDTINPNTNHSLFSKAFINTDNENKTIHSSNWKEAFLNNMKPSWSFELPIQPKLSYDTRI